MVISWSELKQKLTDSFLSAVETMCMLTKLQMIRPYNTGNVKEERVIGIFSKDLRTGRSPHDGPGPPRYIDAAI